MDFVSSAETRERRRILPLWLVLLAGSVVWIACWFVHARGYLADAGFLHLEFARSVATGHGFQFNGHTVYADDSPLWVWLLVAVHALTGDWIAAAKGLAGASVLFALAGVYELARRLTRGLGGSRSALFAAAMVLLMAVHPAFDRWAFSGMEAVAAAGLACWGVAALNGDRTTPGRLICGCLCAGLAPLLRPEMVLFTVLLGLILFVRWVNMPLRFRPKLTLFLAGLLLVMGPVVAWTVYAVRVFGTAIPNAYGASVAAPQYSTMIGLMRVYAVEFPLLTVGVLALCMWFADRRARPSARRGERILSAMGEGWLPLVWSGLLCVFYLAHHTALQSRYVLVSAPVLTVMLFAAARMLWPRLYVASVCLGVVAGAGVSAWVSWPAISAEAKANRDYASLAAFARAMPAGGAIAAKRIGELAFLSEHPVADMTGLTRPGILPFRWDPADNRRVWWAHEQGARYLVLDHAPEPGAIRLWSRDVPSTGLQLTPLQAGAFDVLTVWKLPASPTLPPSPGLPIDSQP